MRDTEVAVERSSEGLVGIGGSSRRLAKASKSGSQPGSCSGVGASLWVRAKSPRSTSMVPSAVPVTSGRWENRGLSTPICERRRFVAGNSASGGHGGMGYCGMRGLLCVVW